MLKKLLKKIDRFLNSIFISPSHLLIKFISIPLFIKNAFTYNKLSKEKKFRIRLNNILFSTADRFSSSGNVNNHYFHQDLWAAKKLYDLGINKHVDIGSRLDGFIGHIINHISVEYVDIRPLEISYNNLIYIYGSITDLPYSDNSVQSLSSLHVVEHIGLGRYGDQIDPAGYIKATQELTRILAPGGKLLFSTPVGRESLHFDAHRIFSPYTIIDLFKELKMLEFNLIDDKAKGIRLNVSLSEAEKCEYGCGLFLFEK